MNSKIKTIIAILIFAMFIAGASYAYSTLSSRISPQDSLAIDTDEANIQEEAENETESEAKNEKILAPDFAVYDADDNKVMLSDFIGKPIVLNFWASWCPPCKSEMPGFNTVYEEMGDDIVFMMIDLVNGQRETKELGEKYIAEQGFTFPVYYDTDGDADYTYGISYIPTTLFIDSDGFLVTGAQSAIDEATLRRGIGFIYPAGN